MTTKYPTANEKVKAAAIISLPKCGRTEMLNKPSWISNHNPTKNNITILNTIARTNRHIASTKRPDMKIKALVVQYSFLA